MDAVVEPWVFVGDDGIVQPGVLVRYFVVPAKRIERIDITGARGMARRLVEESLAFDLGDPWFDGEDYLSSQTAIQESLGRVGWPDARVAIKAVKADDGVRLVVEVDLGDVVRVAAIRVGGESTISDALVRKWMREVGVRVGRPMNEREQEAARLRVVDRLRGLGYDRSRVNVFIQDTADPNRVALNVLISPGPQLNVETKGRGLPGDRSLREILGIRAGDKIGESVQNDAARRLERWYAKRGFLDAEVDVLAQQGGDGQTNLLVRTKTGLRYWLTGLDWPAALPIDGPSALRIVEESSPDILGSGAPEAEAIRRAESAVTDTFVSQGYLDAQVTFRALTMRPRLRLPGRYGVPVELEAEVELGPRVNLRSLQVLGGLGIERDIVDDWLRIHQDKPLSCKIPCV